MSAGFGSDTETMWADALHEQFQEDVPCNKCGAAAELRSDGHHCPNVSPAPHFKCIRCWQSWLKSVVEWMARHEGSVTCLYPCGRTFHSVESFSDYRPF